MTTETNGPRTAHGLPVGSMGLWTDATPECVHDNGPFRGRAAKCLSWYDLVGGRWWIRTSDPRRVKAMLYR